MNTNPKTISESSKADTIVITTLPVTTNVISDNGKDRVKDSQVPSDEVRQSSMLERELTVVSGMSTIIVDSYADEVTKLVDVYADCYLEILYDLFRDYDLIPNETWCSGEDTIIDKTRKIGCMMNQLNIKDPLHAFYSKIDARLGEDVEKYSKDCDYDVKANAGLYIGVMNLLFKHNSFYGSIKNCFSEIDLISDQNGVKSNIDWNVVIDELEDFKRVHYYELLNRFFEIKYNEKGLYLYEFFYDHNRIISFDLLLSQNKMSKYDFIKNVLFGGLNNLLCGLVHVQILIDGLSIINKAPKTHHNFKIAHDLCMKCYNSFTEDLELCKGIEASGSRYERNLMTIVDYISKLKQKLLLALDDWSTPTTRNFGKGKQGNKKKSKGQGNKKQANKKKPSQPVKKINLVAPRKVESPSLPTLPAQPKESEKDKDKDTSVQEISLKELEVIPSLSLVADSVVNDDNSDEDIEEDLNIYWEAFMQAVDEGRRKKFEAAEARRAKRSEVRKKEAEEYDRSEVELLAQAGLVTATASIQEGPQFIQLSDDQSVALNMLFGSSEKCEITRTVLESLFKRIGLKPKGDGAGSMWHLYWPKSAHPDKQAGEYEIGHGGYMDDMLKPGYIPRILEAIQVGIKHNCLAEETVIHVVGEGQYRARMQEVEESQRK